SDDGIKRSSQLMAHAGDELRFVLACLLELPVLVLNFVEQPHVLDGDYRLVSEGLGQLDLLGAERLDVRPCQDQNADQLSLALQGHAEPGTRDCHSGCPQICQLWLGLNVRDVDGFAEKRNAADN